MRKHEKASCAHTPPNKHRFSVIDRPILPGEARADSAIRFGVRIFPLISGVILLILPAYHYLNKSIFMRKIEVCCGTLDEAREAAAGGAVRVELCAAISCGGVTPGYGTITSIVEAQLGLEVNVLIRAREGGFCYTPAELEMMCRDIEFCRGAGVNGVVIGALTAEGDLDIAACKKMVAAAGGMSITFHRAFDICNAPYEALEEIIALGCHRLLTSGQQATAEQGAGMIAELVKRAAGRIIIMPGAGVKPHNIAAIEQATGAREFHSTAAIDAADAAYRGTAVSFAAYPQREGIIRHSAREVVAQLVNEK